MPSIYPVLRCHQLTTESLDRSWLAVTEVIPMCLLTALALAGCLDMQGEKLTVLRADLSSWPKEPNSQTSRSRAKRSEGLDGSEASAVFIQDSQELIVEVKGWGLGNPQTCF